MRRDASIYTRVNGDFGAACDGTADTGYHIAKDAQSGLFTVFDMDAPDIKLVENATQAAAELVIAIDWRKPR